MKTETSSKQEAIDTDLLQRARELCAEADRNGHATICEGSAWLSSSNDMLAIQKEHSQNEDSSYAKFEFSSHPYWLELTDADPKPINGPEDTDLLDALICDN